MTEPFTTLIDLFDHSTRVHAERDLFGTKKNGRWHWITYGDFRKSVESARAGFKLAGVGPGDRVGIVSNNRVEWAVAAIAATSLGAVFVPMYQAQDLNEWVFILKDCGAKVVCVATPEIHQKLISIRDSLGELTRVFAFDLSSDHPDSWARLLEAGSKTPVPAYAAKAEDVAGFIYTSGTTGSPKGVVLTHNNYCSNLNDIRTLFDFTPRDRSLCFLPWAHVFGQTCELFTLLSFGTALALNDELPSLVGNLAEVQPTVLVAVPRIFNRIYDGVNKQMQDKPAFIQKLFHAGIKHAGARSKGKELGSLDQLTLKLADGLVFKKIRARFGGRLRFAISGSAALNPEVAEFVDALGIKVFEGYGLTETSPVVSTNFPGNHRIGSVGKPLPGAAVDIDKTASNDGETGEIIVRGQLVMRGYYQRPEETAAVLSPDGAFRTGDLGRIDKDGYLYITGRIKEQYKLETGKYVAPSPLEEQLKLSPYIANCMLYGPNRPHNVALVVIDQAAVERWVAQTSHKTTGQAVTDDPALHALIKAELAKYGATFKSYERPQAFALVSEDFTVENDMLTPSLKLKRRNVLAKYQGLLDALY